MRYLAQEALVKEGKLYPVGPGSLPEEGRMLRRKRGRQDYD